MPFVECAEAAITLDIRYPTLRSANVEDLGIARQVGDHRMPLQRPEYPAERQMLLVVEIEIAEEEHLVTIEQRAQRRGSGVVHRRAYPKPAHLGPQHRAAWLHRQLQFLNHLGHRRAFRSPALCHSAALAVT